MASSGSVAQSGNSASSPAFYIGQHDSKRIETLSHGQYEHVLKSGFDFATAPITNQHFHARVVDLYKSHLHEREQWAHERGLTADQIRNPSLPGPIVPALADDDTCLEPGSHNLIAVYASPWIDLCSSDPLIAGVSRQVLNLEAAYANFCGATSIFIAEPGEDESGGGVERYARAILEALRAAPRVNFIIHMPMYREPGLDEDVDKLSSIVEESGKASKAAKEIDLLSAWSSWHTIRTICKYTTRLSVALRIPRRMPEHDLQTRWFAEPLHFLTFSGSMFQKNTAGHPCLSKHHQNMINSYMRLKNHPWLILCDVGPDRESLAELSDETAADFPSLLETVQASKENRKPSMPRPNDYVSYLRHLERQQPEYSAVETPSLMGFQDWLQSPLQPLSDNLESATYEVFEGDPVKYNQYELAITEAMKEWKELRKPTSSLSNEDCPDPELMVAVAGAGRGPLVDRVLRAAENTGTKCQVWAVEKNQNAHVYLLGKNKRDWGGHVTVVKTDMRGWEGPRPRGQSDVITKVDILVTELLGSFGDNELSPECLDGIQRHIARPHGISIPHSYSAHLSPISTPRLHADLRSRDAWDPNAFETPWVVRLFAIDLVAAQKVPGRPRFQQAWEFVHPVEVSRADDFANEHGSAKAFVTHGMGSMCGAEGRNEHNTRQCNLTFVCRSQGVIHGLAGYFESTLYVPQVPGKERVEISIVPDQIDRKSKNMVSWFPIFFPLKQALYFPQDTELGVRMWRQTDDSKVWYEWMVDVYAWIGPELRIKVGASELHSSRKVACLM